MQQVQTLYAIFKNNKNLLLKLFYKRQIEILWNYNNLKNQIHQQKTITDIFIKTPKFRNSPEHFSKKKD